MQVSDLPWNPHPLLIGVEVAKFFGVSIVKGEIGLNSKYEVQDRDGEILHFDTDDQLLEYFRKIMPGLFIAEG